MNSADMQTTLETSEIPAATDRPATKDALAFTGADKALIPGMLACGFFYWEWILFGGQTALGVSLFILLLCGVTLLYFGKRGVKQGRASLLCLAVLCLSCVQFAVFDTTVLQFFNLVFASLAYLYWLSLSCGTRLLNRLSGHIAFDMLNQCALTPFGNFTALFLGIRRSVREMKRGKEVLAAAVGLFVFLPLLSVVLSLLIEADDAFDALWQAIQQRFLLPDFARYAFEFILGIPVAAYLYGAVFGNAARRRVGLLDAETLSRGVGRLQFVPGMAFYAPLAVFNAFYALFFVALGNYFFSAFAGRLPEAMSYAEYARKGFFELCGVATINLAVIACVYLLMRRGGSERPRALRVLTGLMSAFTVLLIITAMSKMLLYISAYGFTRLRVYTSWFMLLLLIVFALLLLWHFRAFNPAKPLILVFVVCFMALTWADTDGLIAKYNIAQYENGRTDTLDVQMLETLSDAAAPHICVAWEREKALYLEDLPKLNPAAEYESLTVYLLAVQESETDPRAKTALELGRLAISDAYPHRSAFREQNVQAFRAAALSERALRDLSAAVLE